jgi:5-oxoprolinase (ATP-hydrolysing)
LAGGQAAAVGSNYLQRSDGSVERLSGQTEFTADAGDTLVIETPGGGGFGKTPQHESQIARDGGAEGID